MTTFAFNKDYNDHEQVRHLMGAYTARFDELAAAKKYHYNDLFRGHLGVEFATPKDEDTAIYLCQTLRTIDAEAVKIAAALAEGFVPVTFNDVTEPIRGSVIDYGFYIGGTGFVRHDSVRLVRVGVNSLAVLPKGARTRGHLLNGRTVLVKAGK